MSTATPHTEPRQQKGVSASRLLAKSSLFSTAALVLLLICAPTVRVQGVYWLLDYGPESDFSFHPDDERFIVSAKDFANPSAKPGGYPLFMVTQLVVVNKILKKLSHVQFNRAVILRYISLAWGLAGIVLIYIFAINLGLSRFVGLLASFFLAFAPYHIISSHFGTADMTVLVLFYLTIFAAWRYRVSYREPWLYAAIALAGVAMADKFFLPALVAPTMIVVFQPSRMDYSKFFLAVCVFIAFFCGASFFNFTPWDFRNLFEMLLYDNLVVEGGKSPLHQLFLYSCEIIPSSGVLTSAFAFIGCLVFFRRAVVGWISRGTTVLSDRENIVSGLSHKFLLWLYTLLPSLSRLLLSMRC